MKRLYIFIPIVFMLCAYQVCFAEKLVMPFPAGSGTYAEIDSTGAIIAGGTGSRIIFAQGEYIDGFSDDILIFQGDGGAVDQDMTFDLDGTTPVIYSTSSDTININERIDVLPAVFTDETASAPAGFNMVFIVDPDASTTMDAVGAAYNFVPRSANWGVGSSVVNMQTSALIAANAGSANLDITGAVITGVTALSSTATVKDIFGAKITPFNNFGGTVAVNGDVWGLQILQANTSFGAHDQTLLEVAAPFRGAAGGGADYQVVLLGNGAGTGIWFDGLERMYSDSTNIVTVPPIKNTALMSTYTGGSAYVCVGDDGVFFASEAACP